MFGYMFKSFVYSFFFIGIKSIKQCISSLNLYKYRISFSHILSIYRYQMRHLNVSTKNNLMYTVNDSTVPAFPWNGIRGQDITLLWQGYHHRWYSRPSITLLDNRQRLHALLASLNIQKINFYTSHHFFNLSCTKELSWKHKKNRNIYTGSF
jgi:hypothetical protein